MFKENELISLAVEITFDVVRMMNRGERLTYSKITELTGLDRSSPEWNGFQVRLRKRILKELGIATIAIENFGFQLLASDTQVVECARRRNKKKDRQVLKAIDEISAADNSELPMELQRLKISQLDRLKQERKSNRQNNREISTVTYEPLPTKPIPQ